jgi:hypothetical protein
MTISVRERADLIVELFSEMRATHPYSFRSRMWAKILKVSTGRHHTCFIVEFPDGQQDSWVVDDDDAGYEYR